MQTIDFELLSTEISYFYQSVPAKVFSDLYEKVLLLEDLHKYSLDAVFMRYKYHLPQLDKATFFQMLLGLHYYNGTCVNFHQDYKAFSVLKPTFYTDYNAWKEDNDKKRISRFLDSLPNRSTAKKKVIALDTKKRTRKKAG
jgi:hypothetical protein